MIKYVAYSVQHPEISGIYDTCQTMANAVAPFIGRETKAYIAKWLDVVPKSGRHLMDLMTDIEIYVLENK